jgi:hypothetical protein
MSRDARGLILLLSIGLAACSPEREVTAPDATATPAPSPTTFESDRHGYSLTVPPDWDVTEYEGTWRRLEQFNPGSEVPGEDVVSALDVEAFLVANSMPIPSGMTSAEWQTEFNQLVAEGLDPNCPPETSEGNVAGEPATVVEQRCAEMTIVGRSLTHGDRGYYFTIGFPADDAETGMALQGIVESIRFVDD